MKTSRLALALFLSLALTHLLPLHLPRAANTASGTEKLRSVREEKAAFARARMPATRPAGTA